MTSCQFNPRASSTTAIRFYGTNGRAVAFARPARRCQGEPQSRSDYGSHISGDSRHEVMGMTSPVPKSKALPHEAQAAGGKPQTALTWSRCHSRRPFPPINHSWHPMLVGSPPRARPLHEPLRACRRVDGQGHSRNAAHAATHRGRQKVTLESHFHLTSDGPWAFSLKVLKGLNRHLMHAPVPERSHHHREAQRTSPHFCVAPPQAREKKCRSKQ